ncbi:MAG: recombinase family protein [Oscillospiraceae bacterium]|nr:recombinase family protein [Oscillospiraceae bacterium]
MARVSRKGKGTAGTVAAEPSIRIWNTAVYARLSVEDSGRRGADTIETQIELVSSYISQQPHLSQFDIYADNGVSGKDFERPSWNRLMDDIKFGKVDCVVVKDLSRFSRNYIETIEYIEKIFPFMGVRFISVNDGYDSVVSTGNNERLIIALKSLVNDQYLKDISRKICSSVKLRQERGEYTRGFAPYGYSKSDIEKNKLIVNPDTAPAVRNMFEWRAEGLSHARICKRLNELNIPTPNEYVRQKFDKFHSDFFKSSGWRTQTLKGILANPVYIGTLELGKQCQRLYEHKPCTNVPREEWLKFENVHEPIISMELWEKVQSVDKAAREAYPKSADRPPREENLFKSYMICGICRAKMSRQYSQKTMVSGKIWSTYYYLCPLHKEHPAEQSYRSIRYDTVENSVFPLVFERLKSAANLGEIIAKRMKRQSNPKDVLNAEITRISCELEVINQRIAGLYENYVDKLLTEQEYVGFKAEYSNRAETLKQRIDELSQRAAVISDISESDNKWLKAARDFQNPKKLTREMLEAIVERIEVFGNDRIEVIWKFKDEFELLQSIAAQEFEEGVA